MKALLTCCLVTTLLWVPATPAAAAPPPPARATVRKPPTVLTVKRPSGPEWFGLYLMEKKAGWFWMQVVRERRGGAEVLVARQEMLVQAAVAGRPVTRRQRDEKVYQAHPGGRLLSYESEREGDGGARRVRLSCSLESCVARFSGDGGSETRELPATAETAEQADAARLAAALGGTVSGAQLDPERLREKKTRDVFERRTTLAGAGVELAVTLVAESSDEDRVPAHLAIADDGRIVEIKFGEALVAKAEPEEIARRLDKVDLFNLGRIPLAAPLPRSVPSALAFRVRGLPPEFQKGDDRQRFTPGPAGEVVVTVSARSPAAADPDKDVRRPVAPSPALQEFLQATPEIDADTPAVSQLAAQVAGDTPGSFAASTKLVHFVHRRIESVYGQSRDRASEVLRSGKGDCTEHALLFLAMARALGIPARGAHGLVFAQYDDEVPALYWHAWAEVKINDEWIAVDPTFDQPVADATHITLGRGTQVDSVGLLGALSVVEVKSVPLP
jgi:hypothetical protein